jgi:hypothetical protein
MLYGKHLIEPFRLRLQKRMHGDYQILFGAHDLSLGDGNDEGLEKVHIECGI